MRIAKQIDSRKPRVQPKLTNEAVTEARTNPIVAAEKMVNVKDLLDKRITIAPVPMAIAAPVKAASNKLRFVSYHQNPKEV